MNVKMGKAGVKRYVPIRMDHLSAPAPQDTKLTWMANHAMVSRFLHVC